MRLEVTVMTPSNIPILVKEADFSFGKPALILSSAFEIWLGQTWTSVLEEWTCNLGPCI